MPLLFILIINTPLFSTVDTKSERAELVWQVEVLISENAEIIASEKIELDKSPRHFEVNFENGVSCHVSEAKRDWEIPGDLRSLTCETNFNSESNKVTAAIACDLESKEGNAVFLQIESASGARLILGLICGKIKREVFEPNVFHPFA